MDGDAFVGRSFRKHGYWAVVAGVGLVLGVLGPVSADSFTDDDGGFYEPALDALAERGILDGTECGEGLVCPDEEMQRWVMAVWLVRVLDGADPEGVSFTRFVDVGVDRWWMPFVERLAELGVTRGCAVVPARFCPEASVTRGEMATFLVRAFGLGSAERSAFVDIGRSSHETSIDALAAVNITRGCAADPARFCPEASVTRGQMATFLARALDLVPRPPPVESGDRTAAEPTGKIAFERYGEDDSTVLVMEADGGNEKPLIDRISQDAVWSPDGARIALIADGEVVVVDADGANRRQLTNNGFGNRSPAWSPDGGHIAFVRSYGRDIFLVGVESGEQRRLTRSDQYDSNPVWSPGGERIAFVRHPGGPWSSAIFVVDADGSNLNRLTFEGEENSHPAWSPDGTRIAFSRYGGDLYQVVVMNADGTDQRRLTPKPEQGWQPSWSPDGSQIAYAGWPGGEGRAVDQEIMVMDADGGNRRQLTENQVDDILPEWSPEGSLITFRSRPEGRWDDWEIFTVRPDGGDLRQLTDNQVHDRGLAWSKDGSRIAFTRFYQREIFVIDANGEGEKQVTDHHHEDSSPVWSPDGSLLSYINRHPSYVWQSILAVDPDGSNVRRIAANKCSRGLAWSPDGSRMAFMGCSETAGGEVFVADRSGANLRQLSDQGAYWGQHLSWSPEGDRLAVSNGRDGILVIDAGGGEPRQLAAEGGSPVWSPHDSRIAFSSRADGMLVVDADGGDPKQLWPPPQSLPVWSPDGARIAFAAHAGGGLNVHVVGADGSNLRQLTSNNQGFSPVWSPDGARIAFVSSAENGDVFVVEVESGDILRFSNRGNPLVRGGSSHFPVWSPDSTHIAFARYVDRDYEIFVGNVLTGNLRQLTDNHYQDQNPAWSPEG